MSYRIPVPTKPSYHKWVEVLRDAGVANIHKNLRICSKHFDAACFKFTPEKKLIRNSTPNPWKTDFASLSPVFDEKVLRQFATNDNLGEYEKLIEVREVNDPEIMENESIDQQMEQVADVHSQEAMFDNIFMTTIKKGELK